MFKCSLTLVKIATEQWVYSYSNMIKGLVAEGGWECYGIT